MLPETPDQRFEDYGRLVKSPSGAAGIFACAAAALGGQVGFIGRVGADGFSQFVLSALQKYGVDVSLVTIDPEHQLGLAFVQNEGEGRSFIYYRRGSAGSHLSAEHIAESYIKQSAVVHISAMLLDVSESMRAACIHAIKTAKAHGVLVSVDPNLRRELHRNGSAEVFQSVISQADILTPSEEEAQQITGKADVDEAIDAMLAMGPQIVAVTCGSKGVVAASLEERVRYPAIQVDSIDTVGAGDVFAAGLLVGIVENRPLSEAVWFANQAAAMKVARFGGIGRGLPFRYEVAENMAPTSLDEKA
jgi:sugar/nucleoside kinase (ribokinase family)